MRAVLRLITLCIATAAPAQDLPLLPLEDHADWQAIGRVNAAGYRKREMCSGTLIAPDKVLTAAHCVSGLDGIGPAPERITFVAGWLRGTAADSVQGRSVWVHPKAYARGRLDLHYDIAVITLKREAEVAPLDLSRQGPRAPFALIGYSASRPHMLGADFDCGGRETANLLRLDCAVNAGNSGGPVLAQSGSRWSVIGVVSAMGETGALAVPVTRLPARAPSTHSRP
ncbi:trypsin-like serine protease [Marivita sp. GX14005]|uniref:trypsin-like serine peptidase n=1 Tax=Marivita sp. GX14005 TaxID=2942276 RepID=UPI002019A2B9|nr:trypsin-like serine protease [Marivita sp. GX14005]MCL3882807.1 trypsin-like serine protease [Marivita sp. GX14005]